ncbi:hypothetical protein OKW31_000453 [Paraburkholderia atlantica]
MSLPAEVIVARQVIAKRSIVDVPTAVVMLATVLLLWRFKKLHEPVIVIAAAVFGLVAYPLLHAHHG